MLLLAVDTSGKFGSIALAQCEKEAPTHVLEVVPLQGGTFSAELVPQIAKLLQKFGFSQHNLDGFIVVSGPGSFTGIRIGLTAIKALAEVLQKPIATVSVLEVMAGLADASGPVTAVLDAGRGEIYAGEYVKNSGTAIPTLIREHLCSREEFIRSTSGPVITFDKALAGLALEASREVQEIAYPNAGLIVPPGWEKLQRQVQTSPEELEANYIRRANTKVL
jgi:tRNA threonylcarbamoyladenosine biosynthesis protein TsaB